MATGPVERKSQRQHVVWDWNGTLFADHDAILAATNDAFRPYDVAPLTAEEYRALFTRPLTQFCANVLGRDIDKDEFTTLDAAFHDAYQMRMRQCRIAEDAVAALTAGAAAGRTQSLLSLWTHDELTAFVAEWGLTHHFQRIDGRRGANMAGKTEPLKKHLTKLGVGHDQVTLIGDSVDDAAAARAVGARCVLYDSGTHEKSALLATGFPVAQSLSEAIQLA